MSRFLTPSKICNLVLISMYCDNAVPNRATIPLLSFIISHISPQSSYAIPGPSSQQGSVRQSSQAATPAGSLFLTPGSSSSLAPTIDDFEAATTHHPSVVVGRSLYNVFLKRLWTIDSIDALREFFNTLEMYVASPEDLRLEEKVRLHRYGDAILLAHTSPLGAFVRRARLEYTRLHFGDAVTVWMQFVNFRAPTEETYKRHNSVTGSPNNSFDANLAEIGVDASEGLNRVAYAGLDDCDRKAIHLGAAAMSADDLEHLLELHLEQLQRSGERMPEDIRRHLHSVLLPPASSKNHLSAAVQSSMPNLAHFVRFFDAWRAGDYVTAFDSLHQYFDYSPHLASKSQYQYALLHVAILQADFGKFSEAYATMRECVATARENQDVSCLNYALSWLQHLSSAWPGQMRSAMAAEGNMRAGELFSNDKQSRQFLRLKAAEMKSWNLVVSTLLSEARATLSEGGSPSQALEYAYRASHLLVEHNITSHFGTQMLLFSGIYGRLGLTEMADAYCEILPDCYEKLSPKEDSVRAAAKRAWLCSQFSPKNAPSMITNNFTTGSLKTLRLQHIISAQLGLLKLKVALRGRDISSADQLISSLRSSASTDPEVNFQLRLSEIERDIIHGDFSAAFAKTAAVSSPYDPAISSNSDSTTTSNNGSSPEPKLLTADITQRVALLLMRAKLYKEVGAPEKGLSVAVRAAECAHIAMLVPLLWEAIGLLANILNSVSEFAAAQELVISALPKALITNDSFTIGTLFSTLADSYMGLAGACNPTHALSQALDDTTDPPSSSPPSKDFTRYLAKAEDALQRAAANYSRAMDFAAHCSALAKLGLISRLRGDDSVAEDWAKKYAAAWREGRKAEGEAMEG